VIQFERPVKIRLRESGWVDHMRFDASLVLDGLTWLRVKGGFGGRGDREDWILAVPAICVSVSRWRQEAWDSKGRKFGSREEAMQHAIENGISWASWQQRDNQRKLAAIVEALNLMEGVSEGTDLTRR